MLLSLALTVSLATILVPMATAQDANCTTIYNDYVPGANGHFQNCYADQQYNSALVSQGSDPNYKEIIARICTQPACSRSNLTSGLEKYMDACSASIDAESATGGNILQIGRNALQLFFAEPMRAIYCERDPNAPDQSRSSYCLANPTINPNNRFATSLGIFLVAGSIRASHEPFFSSLDQADTCSPCSQAAINDTVRFLSSNLMPKISFYTAEFVQYWTKLIVAYNGLCKTSFVQRWPEGTVNETVAIPSAAAPSSAAPSTPMSALPSTAPGAGQRSLASAERTTLSVMTTMVSAGAVMVLMAWF